MSSPGVMIIADESIEFGGNYVVGANEEPYHYTGANFGRDFTVSKFADIARAATGHMCPKCGGRIEAKQAIGSATVSSWAHATARRSMPPISTRMASHN